MMQVPVSACSGSQCVSFNASFGGQAVKTYKPGQTIDIDISGWPTGAYVALRVNAGTLVSVDKSMTNKCDSQVYHPTLTSGTPPTSAKLSWTAPSALEGGDGEATFTAVWGSGPMPPLPLTGFNLQPV